MNMNPTFHVDGIKRSACTRCKRLKTKCIWENTNICQRCAKANAECIDARFSDNSTRRISNTNRIRKNTSTSSTLNKNKKNDNISQSIDEVRDGLIDDHEWPRRILKRKDCVQVAIEYNYITQEDAKEMYSRFVKNMIVYLPYDIDQTIVDYDTAEKEQPLLCLAYIVASLWCCNSLMLKKLKLLTEFCERVIMEQFFMNCQFSLEINHALYIMTIYSDHEQPKKVFTHILTSMAIGIGQELGNKKDIEILSSNIKTSNDYKNARYRCQNFASIYVCVSAASVSLSRIGLLNSLPNGEKVQRALLGTGSESDKFAARSMHLLNTAINSIVAITDDTFSMNVDQTVASVDQAMCEIESIWGLMSTEVGEEFKNNGSLVPISTAKLQLTLALQEHFMNKILGFRDEVVYVDRNNKILTTAAEKIVKIAWELINQFTMLISSTINFPKYMYFRPLNALCALTRVRLVLWSCGLVIDTSIERAFGIVESAWEGASKSSHNAADLKPNLDKVLRYVNLKIVYPTANEERNDITYRLLQDVLGKKEKGVNEGGARISSFVSGTNQSEMDDRQMEELIRELFQEIA